MLIRITQTLPNGNVHHSTLSLNDSTGRADIEVIGVLNHCTRWAPAGDEDAAALRDWLEAHYDIERSEP